MVKDIDKFAVVIDVTWMHKLSQGVDALADVDIRTFHADQRDEAMAWLSD